MIVKQLIICLAVFVVTSGSALNAAEISRDARKHMLRGEAAMEDAKAAADYRDAVTEFKKAIEYAPSWADAWFNLGLAQDKAGDYAGAIKSLNRYLKLNPKTSDRTAVEDQIIKLEYRQEKAAQAGARARQAAEEKRRRADALEIMGGVWVRWSLQGSRSWDEKYEIRIRGGRIESRELAINGASGQFPLPWHPFKFTNFDGKVFSKRKDPDGSFREFKRWYLTIKSRDLLYEEYWYQGRPYRSEWRRSR